MSATRTPQLGFGKGEDDKELNNSNVQAHIQPRSKSPAGAPDFVAGDGELTIQVEPGEDVEFVINVEEQSGLYRFWCPLALLAALGYIAYLKRGELYKLWKCGLCGACTSAIAAAPLVGMSGSSSGNRSAFSKAPMDRSFMESSFDNPSPKQINTPKQVDHPKQADSAIFEPPVAPKKSSTFSTASPNPSERILRVPTPNPFQRSASDTKTEKPKRWSSYGNGGSSCSAKNIKRGYCGEGSPSYRVMP